MLGVHSLHHKHNAVQFMFTIVYIKQTIWILSKNVASWENRKLHNPLLEVCDHCVKTYTVNLCNPTPEFSDILWHQVNIYGPKVFLLAKIKPECSDILYNPTYFPGPLVSFWRPWSVSFSHFNFHLRNCFAKRNETWYGASMEGSLLEVLISFRSVNKQYRHRQFFFLDGEFLKILLLWNRWAKWTETS